MGYWKRSAKVGAAGLLVLASLTLMAPTYPSARFSTLLVDTWATVQNGLTIYTGTNTWVLFPDGTGDRALELNPVGTTTGGFRWWRETSAALPAAFAPGSDFNTLGAFLGNPYDATRCDGSSANCQWAALYLRSFTPATTSQALYNVAGALYWNGAAVLTNGTFATGISTSGATAQNHGVTLGSGTPTSTTNALYNASGTLYWNGTQLASGAGYSGSGTTGAITKWTGAASFGNSLLTESGTTLTLTGDLAITAQPYVRVYKSADQTGFSANTYAVLSWNSEDTDTPGWHDPVTNNSRITVATAGTYLLGGYYQLTDTSASGGGWAHLMLRKNAAGSASGGTFLCHTRAYGPNGLVYGAFTPTCVVPLSAADYVEVFAKTEQGASTSLVVEGGAVTDGHFTLVKLF